MVANNHDKTLPDNTLVVELPGLSNIRLLRSSAIYGANASGKSNLFAAAHFIQDFVVNAPTRLKPDDPIGTVPFLLDLMSREKPTEFSVVFVHQGVRYRYALSLNKERMLFESFTAYPVGRPQQWYTRSWNNDKGEYAWKFSKSHLKGDRIGIKEKTRPNTPFLSVAAQFNHEQLTEPYLWFKNHFRFLDSSGPLFTEGFTAALAEEDSVNRNYILRMLHSADMGIEDLRVERTRLRDLALPPEMIEEMRRSAPEGFWEKEVIRLKTVHRVLGSDTTALFDMEDESAGTRKFFSLLGPWIDSLQNGYVVFVDEMASNMHPHLIAALIRQFQSTTRNPNSAQLVLTTHDTTLLNTDLFRRDQIWFTEKTHGGQTRLYPLTSFKPRNQEALQRGYLAGRYGAIPMLREELAR